jgi:hypothetical protein
MSSPSATWDIAANVMARFMNHPLTTRFQVPIVREDTPESNHYFEIITQPQDLGTILSRIQSKQYSTAKQWLADVEQVWTNHEAVHPSPLHSAVTNECRRIFETILRKSGLYPIDQWFQDVKELRERIERKMFTIPHRYQPFIVSKGESRSREKELSQEKLTELAHVIEGFSGQSKLEVSLILAANGELPGNRKRDCVVDLSGLKQKTIRELQDLVTRVTNTENQ